MKIDFWVDINCPYSYIARRQLEKSAKELGIKTEITYRSYLLDPKQVTDPLMTEEEYQIRTFGRTAHEIEQSQLFLMQEARKEGLNIDFEALVVANSFNAHRLIHYAETLNRQDALVRLLFEAHFEEGLNIDHPKVLLERAKMAGLPEEESKQVVNSEAFTSETRRDFAQAHTRGIEGVPYFVINGNFEFSGAMGVNGFKELLMQVEQ